MLYHYNWHNLSELVKILCITDFVKYANLPRGLQILIYYCSLPLHIFQSEILFLKYI